VNQRKKKKKSKREERKGKERKGKENLKIKNELKNKTKILIPS
jgi:hypothetical protein